MLVRLERADGGRHWTRPERVESVSDAGVDLASLRTAGQTKPIRLRGDTDEIAKRLNAAGAAAGRATDATDG